MTQLKYGRKIWTDSSPKKGYKRPINTWKSAQHQWSLGNCKSKPPWDSTLIPLKSYNQKDGQWQALARMWRNVTPCALLVRSGSQEPKRVRSWMDVLANASSPPPSPPFSMNLVLKRDWHTPQHGWTLKALCSGKEASHRTPRILWFHFCKVSRISNSVETEIKVCQGLRGGRNREYLLMGTEFSLVGGDGTKTFWNQTVVLKPSMNRHNPANILKITEKYALRGSTLWHANHISIKLLFFKL